ncbi:12798_t:CDS:2, partial [Racocetra fulgida]
KQQLKAARAKKCVKKSHVFYEQTDYENLVWSDQDIDERASNFFTVLLTANENKNIWKPSGRPSTYVGGSKRTQRCKKAELKKAAQDTRSITAYFAPTLMYVSVEKDIDERTKMMLAIEELDRMLKKDNNQMDKGPVLLEYDDEDLIKLVEKEIPPEEKRHCVITHDETTLSTNDDEKMGWGPKGKQKIRPKGQGRGIHVSEFLCEPLGRVHLTEEQHAAHPEIPKRYVMELLKIGVNYEGY